MPLSFSRLLSKRARITFCLLAFAGGFANSLTLYADDSAVAIVNTTNRIIGGDASSRGQFPYMAALVRNRSGLLDSRQFCGASLISDQWLMTAAHCLFDQFGGRISSDSFRVVVNTLNLRTESPDELIVANYFIHPAYDNNDLLSRNDIALIELANEVSPAPTSVSLFRDDASVLSGFNATVSGWGAIDFSDPFNPVYPVELRHAVVPIVSRGVCNAPISYAGNISDTQMCAGFVQGGVDSCVGDSGGPLVTSVEGTTAQVGIVSFGNGCAEPNFYGVYTNVGAYISWIQQFVSVDTVGTPTTLAGNGIGGSSAGSGDSPSTGGAAWWLLMLLGVFRLRRGK